jgi:hypothetical protein
VGDISTATDHVQGHSGRRAKREDSSVHLAATCDERGRRALWQQAASGGQRARLHGWESLGRAVGVCADQLCPESPAAHPKLSEATNGRRHLVCLPPMPMSGVIAGGAVLRSSLCRTFAHSCTSTVASSTMDVSASHPQAASPNGTAKLSAHSQDQSHDWSGDDHSSDDDANDRGQPGASNKRKRPLSVSCETCSKLRIADAYRTLPSDDLQSSERSSATELRRHVLGVKRTTPHV